MKLYATLTSERASKGQGGNKEVVASFYVGSRDRSIHVGNVKLLTWPPGYLIVYDFNGRRGEIEIKGEQQKGDCAYTSVDSAYCTTHEITH